MSNDGFWPVGWAEQAVFFRDIEERLAAVQVSTSPIVRHSFTPPTQTEWEVSYTEATGRPPPIPVGTKLAWYDLRTGQCRLYTTARNLDNGLSSDGTVYPWSAPTQELNPYRFLGTMSRRGTPVSAVNRVDSTITTFLLDRSVWMRRGLRALHIYFSWSVPIANLALQLLDITRNDAKDMFRKDGTKTIYESSRSDWADTWVTDLGNVDYEERVDLTDVIPDTTTVNTSFIGIIKIDMVERLINNYEPQTIPATNVNLWGVNFGDGSLSSELTTYRASMTRVDLAPANRFVYMMANTVNNDSWYTDEDNQAWVYGLFSDTTDNELGEFD